MVWRGAIAPFPVVFDKLTVGLREDVMRACPSGPGRAGFPREAPQAARGREESFNHIPKTAC